MKVTVAIPTYNRSKRLRETLAGVTRQEFPASDYEILVIDNNSPDDTAAAVAEFAGAIPAPRRIVEPQQGLDYARNRAIRESAGEIIVFADDDILVRPDWIAELIRPFAAPEVAAVGGEVIPIFPDGLPEWVKDWHGPLAFRADAGPLAPHQSPMGANLAIRRSIFDDLGQFHTALDRSAGNYFSGGDAEMVRRIRAAGKAAWFAPAAAVQHQMPASRTTFRYASRHAFDSARSRVIDRAGQPGARGYLCSRFFAQSFKAAGCGILALLCILCFRTGAAKKALVRGWRSCGYVYQILRSARGKI
ncbi:MAG TPA: glycosyltransferase [Opitutaceae bacterium]|jgi:glycosyltransferase involved in cell wall biosynthesis